MTDIQTLMITVSTLSLSQTSKTTTASPTVCYKLLKLFFKHRHYKRCTWTTLKQIHEFNMPYDGLNMFYENRPFYVILLFSF